MDGSFDDQYDQESDGTYKTQMTSPIGSEEDDQFIEEEGANCVGFPTKSVSNQSHIPVHNQLHNIRLSQQNSMRMASIRQALTEISLSKEDLAQSTSRMDSEHINDALTKGLFQDSQQEYSLDESDNSLASRNFDSESNIRQLFKQECDCAARKFSKKPDHLLEYDQLIHKLNRVVLELETLKASSDGLLAENISLLQQISLERASHESEKEHYEAEMKQLLKNKEQDLLNYFKETTSQYHTRIGVYETSIKNHLEHESQLQEFIENLSQRNRDLESKIEEYECREQQAREEKALPEYSYNLSEFLNENSIHTSQQSAIQIPNHNNFNSLRFQNSRKSSSQENLNLIGSFSEELESMKQKNNSQNSSQQTGKLQLVDILNDNPKSINRSKQNTPTDTQRAKQSELFRDLSQFENETATFAMKVMENDYNHPEVLQIIGRQLKDSKSLKQNQKQPNPQDNIVRQRQVSFDKGNAYQKTIEHVDRPKSSLQIMQRYSEQMINAIHTEESPGDQSFIKFQSHARPEIGGANTSFSESIDPIDRLNSKSYIYKSLNYIGNRNCYSSLSQNDKENDSLIQNRSQNNTSQPNFMHKTQSSQQKTIRTKDGQPVQPIKQRQSSQGKAKQLHQNTII